MELQAAVDCSKLITEPGQGVEDPDTQHNTNTNVTTHTALLGRPALSHTTRQTH